MNHAFRETASTFLSRGYSPLPIMSGTKRPALPAWQRACDYPLSNSVIETYRQSSRAYGVGLALGYQGLIALDIDSDDPAVVDAVRRVVPPSPLAKKGKRGRTDLYLDPTRAVRSRRLSGAAGMLIEILAHGSQTVVPPTTHPETGLFYKWVGPMTPIAVFAVDLPVLPPNVAEILEEALRPWLPPRLSMPARRIVVGMPGDSLQGDIERARQHRYATAILNRELAKLSAMPARSGRNNAVYLLACRIGRWCHADILPTQQVVAAIVAAAETSGLVREDGLRSVVATIASGLEVSRHDVLPDLGASRGRGA